jgi:putative DNA primase/helicase
MQDDDDFSPDPPADDAPPDDAKRRLLEACEAEPETDIGNGRRFRLRFGDLAEDFAGAASHIAICVAHIGWHVFDGKRWKEDEDGSLIRRLAHRTAEAIRQEVALIDGSEEELAILEAGEVAAEALERMKKPRLPDIALTAQKRDFERAVEAAQMVAEAIAARRGSRRRHAKSTAGSSKINNMLGEAFPYMARKVQDLNTDPYIVNCLNGTVCFLQFEDEESDPDDPRYVWRAEMREHRQGDFITKMVEAEWSPDSAPAMPEFKKFLKRVQPDPEIRTFLKRFCGYLLTGLTIEQVMLFFYGAGRNGKSTFVDMLCHILGDYAVTLSIDSFSGENKRGGGEATPDLARLPGARLVAASEPEANVKLKDALIKTLTGGEKIPVRRLHKDFFEVAPNFKIILSGNHKPRIDDDSDGIWRRVLLVPWTVQIPAPEVDRALSRKLRAEADGIFAWMVEGAIDYLNHGLEVPAAVSAASEEYRQESDPIGAFIRLACLVTGESADEEKPFDIYLAYDKFATEEGVFKFNNATFAKRFASAAGRSWPGPDGTVKMFAKAKSGTTVYRGIKVKPEWVPSSGDRSRHDDGDGR